MPCGSLLVPLAQASLLLIPALLAGGSDGDSLHAKGLASQRKGTWSGRGRAPGRLAALSAAWGLCEGVET